MDGKGKRDRDGNAFEGNRASKVGSRNDEFPNNARLETRLQRSFKCLSQQKTNVPIFPEFIWWTRMQQIDW